MRSKKVIIALMIIISLINIICIMYGYIEGIVKNSFESTKITQNNYDVVTIIILCVQILNIILLTINFKKSKYTKLIMVEVAIVLIITCFIPVKYERERIVKLETDKFAPGFIEHESFVYKDKNIYSITLKVDGYNYK